VGCAVFATICIGVALVPASREAAVRQFERLMARLTERRQVPELMESPGPLPGEQEPPQGPYLEVLVLSLERLETGELEGRFRLSPRNGLEEVGLHAGICDIFLALLKLWTEEAEPVRWSWESNPLVDYGPETIAIPAAGTDEMGRSFGRVDLVTGASLKRVASGQVHYIIDWPSCPWAYGPNGQNMEVHVWGQGTVDFLRR
jgi:hypothetical protein